MSDATIRAIEEAIDAHFRSSFDENTKEARRGAVIINWVVGFTISNVVEVDGDEHVGYSNDWYAAPGDPNAAVALAAWVSEDIGKVLRPDPDPD